VTGTRLAPGQAVAPIFTLQMPGDARPGDRIPVNLFAETDDGALVVGVTLYFEIE
jgi:hypothetical protein